MVKDDQLVKHQVGVYFQNIPHDQLTGFAAAPYEKAEELGYFKIDFLHLELLNNFENKEQIRTLARKTPKWSLLQDKNVVPKLFHLGRHYDLLQMVRPTSVQELADCIALKLPSKRNLIVAYLKNRDLVRKNQLYKKPVDNTMYFKKGHALAYAVNVVVQLHLINGGIL